MSFKCEKCGAAFPKTQGLQKHMARKRPCVLILEREDLPEDKRNNPHRCRFCGRVYSRTDSLTRHLKTCRIATSEEGMEHLMEHTLQKQLTAQQKQLEAQSVQIAELTALLKEQLGLGEFGRPAEMKIGTAAQVNMGSVTNNTGNVTNVQVNIMRPAVPWDGGKRIDVSVAHIAAAFAENARLKEYTHLEEHQLTDPGIAPPYVTELLMDLTKRAHADPATRNVYLNPRRADQALVHMTSGKWEVLPLTDATRLIFDGVAKAMVRVTMSNEERRRLPLEAQNALAMAGLLYDDEPDEYAKRAKAPMTAHLTNCRVTAPALCS
jgi:hypothetical protein